MGSFSIVTMLSEASLLVKLVILLLCILSIVSWSVIVYKGLQFRAALVSTDGLVQSMFSTPSLDSYVLLLESHQSHFLHKIFAVIEKVKGSATKSLWQDSASVYANGLIVRQLARLAQGLNTLATIGSIAPFIGLFGTILGIIATLNALGSGQASLAVVGPGIGEALYVTAFGIFVSLPAVVAYNVLSAQLNTYEDLTRLFTEQMLTALDSK